MAIYYKELLCEKLQKEYDSYIENLKQKPPEDIIKNAYRIIFMKDLVTVCENDILTQKEAKALYRHNAPLEELYQEWLSNDFSYMDMLRDTVKDRAATAVKELKEKHKESR